MSNATQYCNLKDFSTEMRSVHGYLSLFVCIFGSIANILNICVLTTREMRIPTNFILTGLAVSDLLVMLEYIPFVSHVYLNPDARKEADYFSYPWAIYMCFHALSTQVCHFISCCLTVMLAVWRYIALNKPAMNNVWCTPTHTKLAIVGCYVLCPFVCAPIFLALNINDVKSNVFPNGTLIEKNMVAALVPQTTPDIKRTLYVLALDRHYDVINFLIYGVVLKLIPCILLTVLSVLLIKSLWDAKRRWKNLSNNSGVPLVKTMDQQRRDLEKEKQADRTTRMLLVVLLFFLLPEIPQATLGLMSAVMSPEFRKNCYDSLGDLFDILALVSSSVTFILYCSMSAQFRTVFRRMFKCDAVHDFLVSLCSRRREPIMTPNSSELPGKGVAMATKRGADGGGDEGKNGKQDHPARNGGGSVELNNVASVVNIEANIPDSDGVRV